MFDGISRRVLGKAAAGATLALTAEVTSAAKQVDRRKFQLGFGDHEITRHLNGKPDHHLFRFYNGKGKTVLIRGDRRREMSTARAHALISGYKQLVPTLNLGGTSSSVHSHVYDDGRDGATVHLVRRPEPRDWIGECEYGDDCVCCDGTDECCCGINPIR